MQTSNNEQCDARSNIGYVMQHDIYLVYLAVEFHHLGGLHQLVLKGASHSLPVFPLPTKQHVYNVNYSTINEKLL